MILQKIRSRKHPGAIFLKEFGTDNFVCKVYSSPEADQRADVIITAFWTEADFDKMPRQDQI